MTWLTKILGKSNKNKRGFTLIELMVVVIVVGILAAAAIPIYRFAMSRAYISEAKATIGTMLSSINMFEAEDPAGYTTTVYSKVSDLAGGSADIMSILGVDTKTNTWWHAGWEGTGTSNELTVATAVFGTALAPANLPSFTKISPAGSGPFVYAKGVTGASPPEPKIAGIEVCYDKSADKWYSGF